jgi:hypothetical protein
MKRERAYRHQSRQVALQVLYAVDVVDRLRSAPLRREQESFEDVAANFDLRVRALRQGAVGG